MKWSWGWKGAVIAAVLWVGYVFGMCGLDRADPAPLSQTPQNPVVGVIQGALHRCHRVLAEPGETIINAVWLRVGRVVYPRISGGAESIRPPFVPKGEEGRWVLCPGVYFAPMTSEFSLLQWCLQVRPEPMPFAVHLLLLPGIAAGAMGFLLGLTLALLLHIFSAFEARQGRFRDSSAEANGG